MCIVQFSGYHDIYTGAKRIDPIAKQWKWMNGEPWVYDPPGENSNGNGEDCARIQPSKRQMFDQTCDRSDYRTFCRLNCKNYQNENVLALTSCTPCHYFYPKDLLLPIQV